MPVRRPPFLLSVIDAKGGRDAVAGSILAGLDTPEAMITSFERSRATPAERIMKALEAGRKYAGDKRGRRSAELLVVDRAPDMSPYARDIDLRVDIGKDPAADLRNLYGVCKSASRMA